MTWVRYNALADEILFLHGGHLIEKTSVRSIFFSAENPGRKIIRRGRFALVSDSRIGLRWFFANPLRLRQIRCCYGLQPWRTDVVNRAVRSQLPVKNCPSGEDQGRCSRCQPQGLCFDRFHSVRRSKRPHSLLIFPGGRFRTRSIGDLVARLYERRSSQAARSAGLDAVDHCRRGGRPRVAG